MARHYYSTVAVETTLTSGISSGALTLAVGSTTGYPGSFPYYIAIDSEVIEVTNAVGLTLTVNRGVSGTSAAAHNAGATVTHVAPSDFYNEASALVNDATVVALAALDTTTGFVAQTGTDTFAKRTLASGSASGLTITNPAGIAGNPTLTLQAKLEAIAGSSTNGFWSAIGGGLVANRTITAGSSKVTVTNGNGVSGNPTIDVAEANFTAFPKGVVGNTTIGTSADVGTTETITNSITFTAVASRAYRVSVLTPVLDNQASAAQTAIVTIRHAAGASVANTDTLAAKAVNNTPAVTASSTAGSAAETCTLVAVINNPSAGQQTVGVGLAASSASSNVRFLASGTTGPDKAGVFFVEDIGPSF